MTSTAKAETQTQTGAQAQTVAPGAKPAAPSIRDLGHSFVLRDLFNTHNHSSDFSGSRAEHITLRVRLMALIMALATPTWIVVDFLTLPPETHTALIATRALATVAFLALGLWSAQAHSLNLARVKLTLLLLIGAAFYISSRLILGEQIGLGGLVSGYSFIPFLFLAMLTLFPLTIIEGVFLCLVAVFTSAAAESLVGDVTSVGSLKNLWLMGLIGAFAIGAQISQLQMLMQLHRQATRDALTGMFNRRVLMERLDQEIARSFRYGATLSVLLFDLDRFKRINDTFGHLAGDAVLKILAAELEKMLRTVDISGRYGGEEFLVVLPETDREGARILAERIRAQAEQTVARGPDGTRVNFTVSVGVAELSEGDDADSLFKKADGCLYEAKESGRNRVVIAE